MNKNSDNKPTKRGPGKPSTVRDGKNDGCIGNRPSTIKKGSGEYGKGHTIHPIEKPKTKK